MNVLQQLFFLDQRQVAVNHGLLQFSVDAVFVKLLLEFQPHAADDFRFIGAAADDIALNGAVADKHHQIKLVFLLVAFQANLAFGQLQAAFDSGQTSVARHDFLFDISGRWLLRAGVARLRQVQRQFRLRITSHQAVELNALALPQHIQRFQFGAL